MNGYHKKLAQHSLLPETSEERETTRDCKSEEAHSSEEGNPPGETRQEESEGDVSDQQ